MTVSKIFFSYFLFNVDRSVPVTWIAVTQDWHSGPTRYHGTQTGLRLHGWLRAKLMSDLLYFYNKNIL
jgi:hypothetical protein